MIVPQDGVAADITRRKDHCCIRYQEMPWELPRLKASQATQNNENVMWRGAFL